MLKNLMVQMVREIQMKGRLLPTGKLVRFPTSLPATLILVPGPSQSKVLHTLLP